MPASTQDTSLENALNNFIHSNNDDKLLADLENPICRLVTSISGKASPASDRSPNTPGGVNNLKSALKDSSRLGKSMGPDLVSKSVSYNPSVDRKSPTKKKDILQHAEAVIEYQRERINILEKTLQKYDIAITKTAELHRSELNQYEKQTKDMRMHMQNVISDYDAVSKRYKSDMEDFEALKGKSLQTDSELMKKDKQIKELEKKLEILPRENELLRMEKNDLQQEVRALKNELFPQVKPWERVVDRSPTEPVTALKHDRSQYNGLNPDSRYNPNELNTLHMLCDVRKQETAAMGRCLMQVENDLTSYKRLYEDQRSEIQRLNNILNSKNKREKFENNPYFGSHKQLMYLRDVFVSMVKASNQMSETLKAKAQEPPNHEDRSLHAAYVLKSNSEQREMYDKLLDVVRNMISVKSSTTSFYRCRTDYCKLVELNEFDLDIKFHKMLVEVDDSKVLVHQLEDDQIVSTEIIEQQDLKGVRTDYKNLQFVLKDNHYHVFRFETSDAYNRLYYALQYAGFLVDNSKLSIYSKVDLTYLNSEENWPQDLVPVLLSRVVTMNNQQRSPMNMGNPLNNFQYSMAIANAPYGNMDSQINYLFENVNVMSEFATNLLYYDQNSKLLVAYGPNLANKPKVLNPATTYKFKVFNSLDYSGSAPLQMRSDDENYIDSYQVPFATFPNGEKVMDHFNPQLTNYSLVTVKGLSNELNQLKSDFNQMTLSPFHVPFGNVAGPDLPPGSASPMSMGYNELEFEVYYLLPLTPKYNDQLTKLMDKMEFLRLKSSAALAEESFVEAVETDKFYKFYDGFLELSFSGVGLIKIVCSKAQYLKNDFIYMVTVIPDKDDHDSNSYTFKISDPDLYKKFIQEAESNGIKQLKANVAKGSSQVCIVTKGFIKILTRGPDDEMKPYLVFNPENTEIIVDDEKKTIQMVHNELDFALNMDCLDPKNYNNWILALKVAGFIRSSETEVDTGDSLKLDEFRFDITLFNDQDLDEKRSVRVTSDKIYLFTKPSSHKPIFVWERGSINIEAYAQSARIRIFVKRHSKHEERYDLTFAKQEQFENVTSMLHKLNYKIDPPFNKPGLKYHYIVSRPDKIALFKTKYDKSPLLVIEKKHYTEAKCSSDSMFVKFVTDDKTKDPIKLRFRKRESYNKFVTALKIANFIHFVEGLVPPMYIPEIIYGFACPEAKKVFDGCRS